MTNFAQLQRKWHESAIGTDKKTLSIAQWFYECAIAKNFCDKCDPTIIPPLYIALAKHVISGRSFLNDMLDEVIYHAPQKPE